MKKSQLNCIIDFLGAHTICHEDNSSFCESTLSVEQVKWWRGGVDACVGQSPLFFSVA